MPDWYDNNNNNNTSNNKDDDSLLLFHSRRSPVLCQHYCVATSQPLASSIGVQFLQQGANAADTAIAVAAALAVTEPCSTGLGGDMFALYYSSQQQKVTAINGSGCSPASLVPPRVEIDRNSALSVTVPGAARGWEDLLQRHGSGQFSLSQLLEPAARLAENGFPVSPITAHHWCAGIPQLAQWMDNKDNNKDNKMIPLTIDGVRGPQAGEIMRNPDLARVLRELGNKGSQEGFYTGTTGKAIVQAVQRHGGCLTLEDMANHTSLFPEPISTEYRNVRLWQVPPNGQGVASLIALAGLQRLEQQNHTSKLLTQPGSADWYHTLMEMMRLGFADARAHVACPSVCQNELDWERIQNRAQQLFDPAKATIAGLPDASSCTVSFQVVDAAGNAISFVQSNYMGFGTGIVPEGCGFSLQNRGLGFSLDPDHPNAVGPSKRPYHTIIPGILTHADSNELYATLSNMGGYMQPQGHLQLTVNMVAGGLDPQAAIDMPRFCIADGTQSGVVQMEDGIDQEVLEKLKAKGHVMKENIAGYDRSVFGRAQIIQKRGGVLWAGSDGRADGCAMGF